MTAETDSSILSQCTQTLLYKPEEYGTIYNELHELHNLYAALSGITAGSITDKDIDLPSGNAVSPIKAAHCLLEIQRTAVFVRGIHKAILQLKQSFPGERLNILYAGCGPYATLLTPLTTLFSADELAFYMLDINPASIEAAKKLYNGLQLNNYVAEWLVADATTYRVPNGVTMHLMISETMLNALRKEPQVAIMLNLIPQLPAKGLFVPQEITVTAQLLSGSQEQKRFEYPDHEPKRINLGTVYNIGRYHCFPQRPVKLQIPDEITDFADLTLMTEITTFEDEKLTAYQSSLNMPLKVTKVKGFEGSEIKFTYAMGEKPGFVFEWGTRS